MIVLLQRVYKVSVIIYIIFIFVGKTLGFLKIIFTFVIGNPYKLY